MDLKEAEKEFDKYIENFDKTIPKMERKIEHSKRVMKNCKEIATSLGLNQKEIEVASLIGLLHDIGKLKQIENAEYKKIEHGELAVQILKENNYIRRFIKENDYDEVIFKAIRNHGLFALEEGLSKEELLFTNIIRDADKLDIFYEGAYIFWTSEEEKEQVEKSHISKMVFEEFMKEKPMSRNLESTPLDRVIEFIAFIFDINYKYDFEIIKKEDYINKILDKFKIENQETLEQFEEVRNKANEYVCQKSFI